jgi:hypothetical protein
MRPKLVLRDHRARGPDRDRQISGVCSACGDTLLEWLETDAKPDPKALRERIEILFERHVEECHGTEASGGSANADA